MLKNVKKNKDKLTKNPCDIFWVKEVSQGETTKIIYLNNNK